MKQKQSGVISLDILGGLSIVIVMMALVLPALRADSDAKLNQAAAEHANTFAEAASRWLQDNQSTVLAAANPLAQYTATDIATYLPSGLNTTTPYGQIYSIRVYKNAGKLAPMIVTTGGDTISNDNVRKLAGLIKGGGYIDSVSPNTAKGVFGGWQMAFTNYGTTPGAGHIAVGLFVLNQGTTDQHVYRNPVSGHPELNAINTPLKLNVVVTAGTSDTLCVVGDATTYGRIAADSIGAVMSCQSGKWNRQGGGYWKDPVATYATLPAVGNNTGDVRLVTGLSRAFTWNGASWVALAIDQNGNLSIPGDLTVAGTITGSGRVSGNTLKPTLVAAENTSCAAYQTGDIANSATGLTLSCQSGSWKKQSSGGLAQGYTQGSYCPSNIPCGAPASVLYYGTCVLYWPASGGYVNAQLVLWNGSTWWGYWSTTSSINSQCYSAVYF